MWAANSVVKMLPIRPLLDVELAALLSNSSEQLWRPSLLSFENPLDLEKSSWSSASSKESPEDSSSL